ncbi:MAG: hypothetical protein HWD59_04565 [Coxiellaceae bacterium]|nr:MAG: hypothetical protein HWD59_04565 [Coxiellaceae bacterium]
MRNNTNDKTLENNYIQKLNVVNMAQAVFEGVKHGHIGAFNKGWKRADTVSINGLQICGSMDEVEQQIKRSNLWLLNNNAS